MHLNLTAAEAKKLLGDDSGSKAHGAKTKADKAFGESICRGIILQVKATTGAQGIINYRFHEERGWELDAAWPSFKVALELQGFQYHRHRNKMTNDYAKMAQAVLNHWRLFYCSAMQAKKSAALWVIQAIDQTK